MEKLKTMYYYVTMLHGVDEHNMKCEVVMTYSEKKSLKIAKKFMRQRDSSLYSRYEVDVTLFRRLYKKTWTKKNTKKNLVAPTKVPFIFALPEDIKKIQKMESNI